MFKIRLITAVVLALSMAACATPGDHRAREEYKARPASAGMVEEGAWKACMVKFKPIRPRLPPIELQYSDWRT